ncbi:MAG: GNAT family N-acetyltransferase [Candidatus Eremiobacteraeota bacterium]|nr:GNAT family N-acetyltransferase [Candidatus Eremiobacteraeota bacterium]
MLDRIDSTARKDVIAYLARRPYENVFLQWVVEGGLGEGVAREATTVWRDTNGRVAGVAFFGPQIALAGEESDALDAFAIEARERPSARMIVGPKAAVNPFWARISGWYRPPSMVRRSQPVYALEKPLPIAPDDPPVRQGRPSDLDVIANNSAEMMIGELGYDPRVYRLNFLQGIARLIDRGWWWLWLEDDELRFQCNIGSATAQTAQIQGVWTPPAFRGHGYATRALRAICRHLFLETPTLSLYVNDFNTDAIALYERVGFRRVGEFATYLFNGT